MITPQALRDPAERDALAGEYALGCLPADDMAAGRALLDSDAAWRAAVGAWQDRLLGLTAQAPPIAASLQLWERIERALPVPASAASAAPRALAAPTWWQRLTLWQGVSALALAASVWMAVLLVGRTPEPAGARYLAVLQSPTDQSTGWIVEVQAGGQVRLVPMADTGAVPAGRSLQFWTKLQGAAGPTSLGLVRAGQSVSLPVSRLPGVGPQQLFEITLEPENGSPLDRPTGPILYLGRTVAL